MKNFTLFACLTLALLSCKKEQQKQFIVGKIEGTKGIKTFLLSGTGVNTLVDTLRVSGGSFRVEEAPQEAKMYTLLFEDSNNSATFYADADSRLQIHGTVAEAEFMRIEGDSVNLSLTTYRQTLRNEISKLKNINRQAQNAWAKDSLARYDALLNSTATREATQSWLNKLRAFVKQHNTSPAAAIALYDFVSLTGNEEVLPALLSELKGEINSDFPVTQLLKRTAKVYQKSLVGKSFPSFQTYNKEGKPEFFFTTTGKQMLLLFWNTEDKYSAYLNKKYEAEVARKNKDSISFVAICLDDDINTWKQYLRSKNPGGRQLYLRGGVFNENLQQVSINHTPVTALIAPNGNAVAIGRKGENILPKGN